MVTEPRNVVRFLSALGNQRPAAAGVDAVVGRLVLVPADADAEVEATARDDPSGRSRPQAS